MVQLRRRLADEKIKVLLQSYCLGKMRRAQVQEMLGVGKTRFFALMKFYILSANFITILLMMDIIN